ncbi:50S ribosome-binding protein YggL [Myxococcus xanthus]|uniref:DUF469 family protein n=1 Tax=Myxococcus xanthus TaxID=34 RepID=A0A7Y4IH65_MYXXA|nr:50S ribosome-binding protein YggL [Myxococcus xanthus]NOJ79208.1 DUF469 family protein [Myxococcus xanthus]NOJ86576.1 DUF469 family protein [Myxococcus xanthus]
MNNRLRKKKRVGEFKELGFELLGYLRPGISSLQGFGFSGRPTKKGMYMSRMGHLWAELMTRVPSRNWLAASRTC